MTEALDAMVKARGFEVKPYELEKFALSIADDLQEIAAPFFGQLSTYQLVDEINALVVKRLADRTPPGVTVTMDRWRDSFAVTVHVPINGPEHRPLAIHPRHRRLR